MASIPYLAIGPTAILSFIGLLYGQDKTIPTPTEDWKTATVEILIPAQNEEKNIVLSLSSILEQSVKPWRITLVDDGSTDGTSKLAKEYSKAYNFELNIIHNSKGKGKTVALREMALNSEADVVLVLDADTILRSTNFIERLVFELYQGVGIACASGVVLPFMTEDRKRQLKVPSVMKFSENFPFVKKEIHSTKFNKIQQRITDLYREELYLFLQKFIYHSEMVYFGTIIHPIGCAVAYRKKYLKKVFEQYFEMLGNRLSVAEDNFLGFAFLDYGYHNIQLQDIYALSQEPLLSELPKQMLRWSSGFFQSCYYFNELIITPFKFPRVLTRWFKEKVSGHQKRIQNIRKIKEAYRESFGSEYTKKYGRPIGWYIFSSSIEKLSFPVVLFLMFYYKYWEGLIITICVDVLLFTSLTVILHKNRRIKNLFKCLLLTPIRYLALMFDIYVIGNFIKDLMFSKQKEWKI